MIEWILAAVALIVSVATLGITWNKFTARAVPLVRFQMILVLAGSSVLVVLLLSGSAGPANPARAIWVTLALALMVYALLYGIASLPRDLLTKGVGTSQIGGSDTPMTDIILIVGVVTAVGLGTILWQGGATSVGVAATGVTGSVAMFAMRAWRRRRNARR